MKVVVGLGNPGEKYRGTRHNVGFLAVDRLIDQWKAAGPNKKFNGSLYQSTVSDESVVLVKPETFMNRSGSCVAPLLGFYKLMPEDLIVIHDDLDLQFETLRIKKGGGTGGHNGLKSIDHHLGVENRDYHKIRIGIGRPENDRINSVDWVLQRFSADEMDNLNSIFDRVTASVELLINGKASEAMNLFNNKQVNKLG